MNNILQQYDELVQKVLETGESKGDRTGAGTISLFGEKIKIDVSKYAPLTVKRRLPIKSVIGELLWMLQGDNNADVLKEQYNCNFWDEWKSLNTGTIGPMYGYQWRKKIGNSDQLQNVIRELETNPYSRRLLIDVWEPTTIPYGNLKPHEFVDAGYQALAPCHFAFQLNCVDNEDNSGYLVDLQLYQRSCDLLLGGPCNIAFYYLMLYFICNEATKTTGKSYKPRNLIMSYGDVHIYKNQIEEAKEYLSRADKEFPTFQSDITIRDLLFRIADEDKMSMVDKVRDGFKDYNPHKKITIARNV